MHKIVSGYPALKDIAKRRQQVLDAQQKTAERILEAQQAHEAAVARALDAGELPPKPIEVGDSPEVAAHYRRKLRELDGEEQRVVKREHASIVAALANRQEQLLEGIRKRLGDLSPEVEEMAGLLEAHDWLRRVQLKSPGSLDDLLPDVGSKPVDECSVVVAAVRGEPLLPHAEARNPAA